MESETNGGCRKGCFIALAAFGGLCALGVILLIVAAVMMYPRYREAENFANETIMPLIGEYNAPSFWTHTHEVFRKTTTLEQLEAYFGEIDRLGILREWSTRFGSLNQRSGDGIDGPVVVIPVEAAFSEAVAEIRLTLASEDDEWKVVGIYIDSPLFAMPASPSDPNPIDI